MTSDDHLRHNQPAQAARLLFLGTGTSHGVPVIGCDCPVCTSTDPRNNRTRSSALVQTAPPETTILIDTSVDFRLQALRHRISHIDVVLFTHHHADHIFGLDDLRTFSDRQGRINCYASPYTADHLRTVFGYAFAAPDIAEWGGLPRLNLHVIHGPFEVNGHTIIPIELPHGPHVTVLGYRIGGLAYLTDCSDVPDAALEHLRSLDVVVIDALRPQPHPTHFSIDQAVAAAERIGARRTYFTHISHRCDHAALAASLPPHIQPAWDGLAVDVQP